MEPKLNVSADASYYFSNQDYTDYRELICFERPTSFVLHFYFGFVNTRLWLFDRFAFVFNGQELVLQHNALARFFSEQQIVKELVFSDEKEFDRFLWREISARSALIAPIESRIGSSTVVTSFLLEQIKDNDRISCTCLRGDDFFIAKSIPQKDIYERLYRENESVKFHRISVPDWIVDNSYSSESIWEQFDFKKRFLGELKRYYVVEGQRGRSHLTEYLRFGDRGCDYFAAKVAEGFVNVLLVELFWPMLFAYSPFVVFLRNSIREKISLWTGIKSEYFLKIFEQIELQAQQITNLGYIFGRLPSKKNYERFVFAMEQMITRYGEVEEILIKNLDIGITYE